MLVVFLAIVSPGISVWTTEKCFAENTTSTVGSTTDSADTSGTTSSEKIDKDEINFGKLSSFLVGIFTPFIAIQAGLIGGMMGNEFILGTADSGMLGVSGVLKKLWQVVRDLVNYAFIIVLVVMAFMTTLTAGGGMAGGEGFDLKKSLGKFFVAVVGVNFTWFGGEVILDASLVTTNIIYGIPKSLPGIKNIFEGEMQSMCAELEKKYNKDDPSVRENDVKVCGKMVQAISLGDTQALTAAILEEKMRKGGKLNELANGLLELKYGDSFTIVYKDFDFAQFNYNTVSSLFAFGIMNVQSLPMSVGSNQTLRNTTVHSIVAFMMMVLILIVFTAMFFALLSRILVIWINMILAPLGVLKWVLGDISSELGSMDTGNEMIGVNAFFKAAFLPAMISLPMVFGMVMVQVGRSSTFVDQDMNKIFGFEINGIEKLVPNVSSLHQFFWYIIAIMVIWSSVKIAEKNGGKFAEAMISPIRQGIETFTTAIIQSPLYAKWIPIQTKTTQGNISLAGGSQLLDSFKYKSQNKVSQNLEKLGLRGTPGYAREPDPQDKNIIDNKNLKKKDFEALASGTKNLKDLFGQNATFQNPQSAVNYWAKELGIDDQNMIQEAVNNINTDTSRNRQSNTNNTVTTTIQNIANNTNVTTNQQFADKLKSDLTGAQVQALQLSDFQGVGNPNNQFDWQQVIDLAKGGNNGPQPSDGNGGDGQQSSQNNGDGTR